MFDYQIDIRPASIFGRYDLWINVYSSGYLQTTFTGHAYTWRGVLAAISKYKSQVEKSQIAKEYADHKQLSFLPSDNYTEEFPG